MLIPNMILQGGLALAFLVQGLMRAPALIKQHLRGRGVFGPQ